MFSYYWLLSEDSCPVPVKFESDMVHFYFFGDERRFEFINGVVKWDDGSEGKSAKLGSEILPFVRKES